MRLLILTEIPAPFRIPGFNALGAQGVELHVVVVAEHDPRRRYDVDPSKFSFTYYVLRGRDLRVRGRWLAFNSGFGRLMKRIDPDVVVVGGWNQPVFWQALFATRRRGIPSVLWVESTAHDARMSSRISGFIRGAALRLAEAFVVPGRASAHYLEQLGVEPTAITTAFNAVEPNVVGAKKEITPRTNRDTDECVFLYVGRLEPEKGLDVLVRAMRDVPGKLVIVGEGSRRAELERLAPDRRVVFPGHALRPELRRWYEAADVFVLPSRSEPWGMVLNEAAMAGMPLVATEAVGAAYDLIEPNVNGYLVPPDDVTALADALQKVGADADWRASAGRRSQEIVQAYTPEAWAIELAKLVRRLSRRRKP
jgi:glycosyltransferase involved in cell wall biosynthesis